MKKKTGIDSIRHGCQWIGLSQDEESFFVCLYENGHVAFKDIPEAVRLYLFMIRHLPWDQANTFKDLFVAKAQATL